MVRIKALTCLVAMAIVLLMASTSCNAFIGAGINLDKQFGDTINFNFGKNIPIGNTAFGLAGLNLGVTWGVDYDLNALAGYPYGYGNVGSVTQGNLGYNLGITMDATQGAGFNGADWGVPLAQQGITTTHLAKQIAENAQINDVQVLSPWG